MESGRPCHIKMLIFKAGTDFSSPTLFFYHLVSQSLVWIRGSVPKRYASGTPITRLLGQRVPYVLAVSHCFNNAKAPSN